MKLILRIDKGNYLDLFLIFLLSNEFVRIIVGNCLGIVNLSSYSSLVTGVIIWIPLILYVLQKRRTDTRVLLAVFVIFCSMCFFGISYILHPSYGVWYSRETYGAWDAIFSPISGSIYTILVFALCRDIKRISKNFKYISIFQFLSCSYQLHNAISRGYWEAYNASGEVIESSYNVDFGYKVVFICLLFLMSFILEKRKLIKMIYLVLSIISATWVILYGSRGSIFALGTGLILFLGFKIRSLSKSKQCFIWIISTAAVVAVCFFYKTITAGILFGLSKLNVNSRTFTMILNGEFMNANGRDNISELAIELIKSQGFFGSGAFGDRPVIGPIYYWGYCHTVVLEFLIDFGVFIGILLLCVIGFMCFKYYFCCKDWDYVGIFIAIFSINMKLFFSDTFWGFKYFWLLMSLLIFIKRDNLFEKTKIHFKTVIF